MLNGLLIILMSFQTGLVDGGIKYGLDSGEYETYFVKNQFYAEFAITAIVADFIFIEGRLNNRFYFANRENKINFSPDHDEYEFIAGMKYEAFELAYRHKCYHPIFPYQETESEYIQAVVEGSYDEFYIKVEGKL